jgi:hypothetical protein
MKLKLQITLNWVWTCKYADDTMVIKRANQKILWFDLDEIQTLNNIKLSLDM